ncbi:diguanylate cyclase [Acidiphilium sp.]|uniref:GGDEF domain-containing protein n=1 Tax=Acidiphilium sp. TaxID=527 RepID=UPI003D01BBEC
MASAEVTSTIHTLGEAKILAERTLDLLVAHRVAPTPRNYTVIYDYFDGTNSALQKSLDQYLQAGRMLDDTIISMMYERHVAFDQFSLLRGMGGDLEKILNALVTEIGDAGQGAKLFGQKLQAGIGDLTSGLQPRPLQIIAAELKVAAEQAQRRNAQLQERLETTLAETISLRDELEQRRRDAMIDPLTGLLNRRAMDAHLSELLSSGRGQPFSVLMVDIDHFKLINDTYGHALGDAVIRNVADVIRKSIRGGDFAVRYGGEEFVIVLPDTPIEGAIIVAETIRGQIESLRLRRNRDNAVLKPFTASVGVAERSADDTQDSLLQKADRALYISKKMGRNRVTTEDALAIS